MLRRAINGGYCSYPALDSDPFFDSIRNKSEFQSVRQAGIDCQRDFAVRSNAQNCPKVTKLLPRTSERLAAYVHLQAPGDRGAE